VSQIGQAMGYTTLTRQVNDNAATTTGGFKGVTTDSRARRLDGKGITNRFRGHLFFINEHHFLLFHGYFPAVAQAVLTLSNNHDMGWHQITSIPGFMTDLQRVQSHCPNGYRLLMDQYKDQ
jgi:hypothetical protein